MHECIKEKPNKYLCIRGYLYVFITKIELFWFHIKPGLCIRTSL